MFDGPEAGAGVGVGGSFIGDGYARLRFTRGPGVEVRLR